MSNIIIEGLDFTGKTPIASRISEITNLQLVNKENISDIINNYDDINNFETTLTTLNSIDNSIFDRHFMSLLVYWKLTNRSFYDAQIDEEKIFHDFLSNNQNSVLLFRYSSHKRAMYKVYNRLDFKEERLSAHDLNLLDDKYFYDFSNTFHSLFNRLEKYNIKQGSKITTIKQSSYNTYFNSIIEDVLNAANIPLIEDNNNSSIEKKNIITVSDNYILQDNKVLNKIVSNEVLFSNIYKNCIDYVIDNNYCNFPKSKFVELNLNTSLNFYGKGLIISYWKEISIGLENYINLHYKTKEDQIKLKKCFLPLLMNGTEYIEFRKQLNFKNIEEINVDSNEIVNKHNKITGIEGLELRFHKTQLVENIDEYIDTYNKLPYEEWLKYYKFKKIKPSILKFLYLKRLKKEDYKKRTFSAFLMDLKYFGKYEFLYPLLKKYLEFGFIDDALNTLTHIHKMGGLSKEPIGLLSEYSDFFNLVGNLNLSEIDDFNHFLYRLFSKGNYDLARSIYRKIPTKIKSKNKEEILYKNDKTEEIYISNLTKKDLSRDFSTYGYADSDRSFLPNTYLKIVEKFLEFGQVDYAIKSMNKFNSIGSEMLEEFKSNNLDFLERYYSLNLDFSDNETLVVGLNKGLSNDNSYKYALEVIKSMKVLHISIQHGILPYLKDEDLLFIFNRTLGAKAIKGGGEELGLYALDFLKRFIKIGDKSRCTSCINTSNALGINIPKEVIESYDEMIRVGDIKNTKFLSEFSIFEKLFRDGKYEEAKQRYNSSEGGRSLGAGYYAIYIENINDEDFVIEKIRGLNLHLKGEKFLNICLKKAFKLDISKVDQSLFFNTYIFIEDLLKKIENKKYRLTEENLELYKDYLDKKNNGLLPVLKKDKSKASLSKKIMLDQNINFSKEEKCFIDNLSRYNTGGEYGTIINNDHEINLQSKGVILKYLLLNNYYRGIDYFAGTAKSNELIFVFTTYAEEKDIINKFDPILLFLLKEQTNLKLDVNEVFNDNQFGNIRKQDVYRIIKDRLSEENKEYSEKLKLGLEKIGFKNLDKAFVSTILYKINGYDFKQKHLDSIIEISRLDESTKFHRNYLMENYNYLTYLSNVHIRGEKKGANRDKYSDALLEVSEILLKDGKINDKEFKQLELFFNKLKKDHSKGIRKQGLTLFEIVNNEFNSNINDIVTEGSFNEIELGGENIRLSDRGVFLYYLFKTDYNKAISYFGGNSKTNTSILLFINFAKEDDINRYSDNIINYFCRQKIDNQDSPYSKGEYKGYTNIRSDFVYNVMNTKLGNRYDLFLNKIKSELSKKGFEKLSQRKINVKSNIDKILDKFNSGDFWEIDSLLD